MGLVAADVAGSPRALVVADGQGTLPVSSRVDIGARIGGSRSGLQLSTRPIIRQHISAVRGYAWWYLDLHVRGIRQWACSRRPRHWFSARFHNAGWTA